VVYFPDWGGYLYAVRAGNGKLIWSHRISDYNGQVSAMSRISPAVYQGELIIGDNVSQAIEHNGAHIMAVDGKTGKLLWITQVDPHPAAIITGSPVVSGGTVYVGVSSNEEALATNNSYPCCTHRGSMVALSAQTGQILWQTYTIPDNGGQTVDIAVMPSGAPLLSVTEPCSLLPATTTLFPLPSRSARRKVERTASRPMTISIRPWPWIQRRAPSNGRTSSGAPTHGRSLALPEAPIVHHPPAPIMISAPGRILWGTWSDSGRRAAFTGL